MLQANGIVPYAHAGNGQNAKSQSPAPGPSSLGNSKKRKAPRDADVKPVIVLSDDDDEDFVKRENDLKVHLFLYFVDDRLISCARSNSRKCRKRKRCFRDDR